jgi:hypothetical protein
MKIDFSTNYPPKFSFNLCNLKGPSYIALFEKWNPFRVVKKVTQVTWIFWNTLSLFVKKMTTLAKPPRGVVGQVH